MGKKFFTLFQESVLTKLALVVTLIVGGVSFAWGDDDPSLEVIFSRVDTENSTQAWTRYIKNYTTEGITLYGYGYSSATTSFGTYSDVSSTRYFADNGSVNNHSTDLDRYYFSVNTITKNIKRVSFLLTHDKSSKSSLTPVLLGWEGTPSTTADIANYSLTKDITSKNFSDAEWYDYDFSASDKELKEIRIYRGLYKNVVTVNDELISTAQGSGITMRIWGVKVWTEDVSVVPNTPEISLPEGAVNGQTIVKIDSKNAETIFYCWSDISEAPTVGSASYSSASGFSFSTKVPNVTATKYLHVYGQNEIGNTSIVTREYNVTRFQYPANLSYNRSSVAIQKNGNPYNTCNNPHSLTITYSITNNGTGSTINATTGTVKAGNIAGEETITATSAETTDYYAGEATYTLIVKQDATDLEAVSPGYVFIGENFTNKGKVALTNDELYDSNHIYSSSGNTTANNKGSSTFSDNNSYLNCVNIKSSYPLVFKVDRPCKVTFHAQSTSNSCAIKVGSTNNSDNYGTIPDSDPADGDHTIIITSAGFVYLSGTKSSDRFFAGFEVEPLTTDVTIASSGWSSFSFNYDLDFANATDESDAKTLQAYVLSSLTKTSATLTSVDTAPASTGVILKGTSSETYTIPVPASADAVGTNKLVASVTETAVNARTVYVVSGGKLQLFTGTTVPENKAYLPASEVPEEARGLSLAFDEDNTTTSIYNIEHHNFFDGDFINLAGQRVAIPSKGFYIVNGKKVIIK